MSSPIQPPPVIRRPPSSLSQPHTTSAGQEASSFTHQYPPAHLPSFQQRSIPNPASLSLQPPPLYERPYQPPGIASPSVSATSSYPITLPSVSQSMQEFPPLGRSAGSSSTLNGNLMNAPRISLPPVSQYTPNSVPNVYADSKPNNAGRPGTAASSSTPFMASKQQQQQQPPPPPPTGNESTTAGYRPLNVRDALTYLDQVKIQFSSQPDVYNRFLDIMKDFKSQAIDTPGVIERVSMLFHGRPDLISGFNAFLPPGYHIECSTDPREPDMIKVTTPLGTTVTKSTRMPSSPGSHADRSLFRDTESHSAYKAQSQPVLPNPHFQHPYSGMGQPPHAGQQSLPQPPPPYPHALSQNTHPSHPPDGGIDHEHRQPKTHDSAAMKRAPLEFSSAISYVNRIKTRFSDDPETYRQFLEILQMYQKERRPIQEVYAQVQQLFNGADDLLYEFKQFLPEITGQSASELFDADVPLGTKRSLYGSSPPTIGFQPPGKKRLQNKQSKSSKADDETIGSEPFDPDQPSVNMEEIELFDEIRRHIGNKPSYEEFLKTLNLYTQQIIDADELLKQVDGFLGGNKELIERFNKVIGLEPKEQVIERPAKPIPKPDLTRCQVVEDSPSYRIVPKEWQNQPCSGRDQLCWEVLNDEYVSHPIWASEDSGFVASKKNQYEEAMHRCEEERYDYDLNIDAILNTVSLLEPIVEQLDGMTEEEKANFRVKPGLGGQSITIYERVIKKVYEDERGNEILDLLYSNPGRVIPVLYKRLVQKDKEWRKAQLEWNKVWREMDAKNFYRSLDYQGLTFKSNDRKAMAVKSLISEIETLHQEYTSKEDKQEAKKIAYPPVYTFGDPEVFKDVSRLVFSFIAKQSGFSSSDRGKIRTFMRIFIPLFFHEDDAVPEDLATDSDDEDDDSNSEEDAQSICTEDTDTDARSQRTQSRSPPVDYGRSRRTRADDTDSNVDLLRDVLTKSSKNNAGDDKDSVARGGDTDGKSPLTDGLSATPAPDADDCSVRSDQEQDIVKTEENGNVDESDDKEQPIKKEDEENASEMTPVGDDKDAESQACMDRQDAFERSASALPKSPKRHDEGNRLFAAAAAATAPGVRKRTVYTFFCNSAFYCFFRLYQMVYERLAKMKQLDAEIKENNSKGRKFNKVALDLGLYSSRFDDIELSQGYYQALLNLIDRFFDGDLDQATFEEKARYIFVTEAHVLFTIDKLIQSMIKQIQAVTMEEKSVELVDLYRGDQTLDSSCPRTMTVYRLRAEEIVGPDENLYKISFNTDTHQMTIQLLDHDDAVLEPSHQDHYENYVASYLNWTQTTEGINTALMKPTFLNRNCKPHDKHLKKIVVKSGLHYKIAQETYHMYFIFGSEDAFIRPQVVHSGTEIKSEQESATEPSRACSKWQSWLESPTTGWAKDIEPNVSRESIETEARKLYM